MSNLPAWQTRCAQGFDVHAFEDEANANRKLILCGVELDYRPLKGHSDADVGLHAITDALYGTLAAGDIGQHFPPSDPQWKGAKSDQFLIAAAKMVRAKGGHIEFVDLTLICEQPKIGPHRAEMQTMVAAILQIPTAQVSIKATTSEKLGFTGREEGIAALSAATVLYPRGLV
ncbi:MAG: 2-C-methyl-D-erythritol 2,4-cyclodiphosphate synthase [Alphaproteobacteria bacterium]